MTFYKKKTSSGCLAGRVRTKIVGPIVATGNAKCIYAAIRATNKEIFLYTVHVNYRGVSEDNDRSLTCKVNHQILGYYWYQYVAAALTTTDLTDE